MINFIPATTRISRHEIGEQASLLARVAAGGIKTIPTIIIAKEALIPLFQGRERSSDEWEPSLLASLKTVETQQGPRLDVRASFDITPPGFPEYLGIRNSVRSLKRAIEGMLDVWFDDRVQAFRIVQELEGPEIYPSLMIQAHVKREWSLTSREPVTGQPLTASNCEAITGVTVKTFLPAYASMLERVESAAGFPVQVAFAETPAIELCRVEKETMTGGGALSALAAMRATGVLDTPRMLLAAEPDMLATCYGGTVVTNPECVVAHGRGLPASQGHTTGKALFREDPVPTEAQSWVFVCEEVNPEDVEHLRMCRGVLASRGGVTSHAALIMRSWGRPAVTSAGCLTISKQGISIDDAPPLQRDIYVHVDGSKGTFDFSRVPLNIAFKYTPSTDLAFLAQLRSDLHSLTDDRQVFSAFSVEEQIHFSDLIRAFALIGLGEP